jgi:hypothetical protein
MSVFILHTPRPIFVKAPITIRNKAYLVAQNTQHITTNVQELEKTCKEVALGYYFSIRLKKMKHTKYLS